MKRNRLAQTAILVSATVLAIATPAMANLLVNPGFETDAVLNNPPVPGATGWTAFNGAQTASSPTDPTRTGIGSLILAGGGGFSVPGAFQTFPAVPGQVFDFQGYVLATNTLAGGATFGVLKIVWNNGTSDLQPAGATIGTAVTGGNPGIESTPVLNSASTPNVWQFTRAQGVAPAGTTQVKVFALMVDQNAGTAYFDDLQVTNTGSVSISTSITLPAANAIVGNNFTVIASASVLPGGITNVSFYRSNNVAASPNVLLGSDTTAPYSVSVNGTANGSYALRVIASGTNGVGASISATSSVVNVTVDAAKFNLVPNGNFETAAGAYWTTGGPAVTTFPASGGNPDGYGDMDSTGGWGVLVMENNPTEGVSLASLGMTAGNTYAFSFDMIGVAGGEQAGIKIEAWNSGVLVGNSGDMKYTAGTAWATFTPSWTIPASATSVKFVPLSVDGGHVGFDNVAVVSTVLPPSSAFITSPANAATVSSNFTISAFASAPSGVASVDFYAGNTLVGNDATAPYSFDVTGASDGPLALKVVANPVSGTSITSSVVNVTVVSTATYFVDPSKNWVGYMNWFDLPINGGAFIQGSAWGTAELKASFSGSTLTLSPNSIADPDPVWYQSTGNNSVGNRIMEANMYVEPVVSAPGQFVTFTGLCLSNSMTTNAAFAGTANPAGNGWTCVAFVKDFAPDYSSFNIATVPVTNGVRFDVSLATIADPARHVQYGFTTMGPPVWTNDVALASYGNVVIAPGPSFNITPSVNGANVNLSFPSVSGYSYQAQYKNNLTDANWINLGSATNGTGSNIILTDTHTLPSRFYRVSAQ